MKNNKAFTLVEIVIVAVIIGFLAFVTVPNMLKSVNHAYAKEAMQNLMAIYASEKDYAQNHDGKYPPGQLLGASAINTALGLNIVENNGIVYSCNTQGNGEFECKAVQASFTEIVWSNSPLTLSDPTACIYDSDLHPNPCCSVANGGTPVLFKPCP